MLQEEALALCCLVKACLELKVQLRDPKTGRFVYNGGPTKKPSASPSKPTGRQKYPECSASLT